MHVSVSVAIYGNFDVERLHTSLLSARAQVGVDVELVVAEEGPEPRFTEEAEKLDATYVFVRCPQHHRHFDTGRVRNHALRQCAGELVYLTDADIVLQDPRYLQKLASLADGKSLVQPPMRRLAERDVDRFTRLARAEGIDAALTELNCPDPYRTSMNGDLPELTVIDHKGRTFTVLTSDFERYRADESLRGTEPTLFYDIRHIGGAIARRDHILSVGGFAERYHTWGFEDRDLQWKLQAVAPVELIPQASELTVVHLDHAKHYYSSAANQRNKEAFAHRKGCGVASAVAEDVRLWRHSHARS